MKDKTERRIVMCAKVVSLDTMSSLVPSERRLEA